MPTYAQDKRSSWLSDRTLPVFASRNTPLGMASQRRIQAQIRPLSAHFFTQELRGKMQSRPGKRVVTGLTNTARGICGKRRRVERPPRRSPGLFQCDVGASEVETILPCLWAGDELQRTGTLHRRVHRYRHAQQLMRSNVHQQEAV